MGTKMKNLELCFIVLILLFRYKYWKPIRKIHYYNLLGKIQTERLRENPARWVSHLTYTKILRAA